jgi:SAM-dependent methyltransferase
MPWALNSYSLGERVLELGPGPGLSTDWLRRRCRCLTCLEIDPDLAGKLQQRFPETNVKVFCSSATQAPFANCAFDSAVCFTMLHHVPSSAGQDRVFAEVYRVLRPGGIFIGTDSVASFRMRMFHLFDTMVLVDPGTLPARLEAAGFRDVQVEISKGRFCFAARH